MALAAALVLLHAGLVLHQAAGQSATYDEPYYATAGWARLTEGGPSFNPEHPPAVKLWLGLSWLGAPLPGATWVPGFAARDQWTFGPSLLYWQPERAAALLLRARAAVALLSGLLAAGVFLVGRRAFGPRAGLFGLALYALDPLVVAHAGLATLDLGAAATIFAAVATGWVALERGGRWWLAGAALGLGLALGAKATGLVALPALAALAVAPALARGGAAPGELGRRLARLGLILAGGGLVVSLVCLPEGPAGWWRAFEEQRAHAVTGHTTWAFGRQALGGWGWYFAAAWLVKTPLPVLAATLGGVALAAWSARRAPVISALLLAVPALVFTAGSLGGIQNGVRQLLPMVPFLAVAGGRALDALASSASTGARRRASLALAPLALLAWLGASLAAVHPDALTYSNELAGGPTHTWRRLSDSNVDWGQALPRLGGALEGLRVRRVWLEYFGTALPAASGLDRVRMVRDARFRAGAVLDVPRRDGLDPDGRVLLAVSATSLVDAYVPEQDLHAWLRARRPMAWAGSAIALYDLTGDAEAHEQLARMAARMGDGLTAGEALAEAARLRSGQAPSPPRP